MSHKWIARFCGHETAKGTTLFRGHGIASGSEYRYLLTTDNNNSDPQELCVNGGNYTYTSVTHEFGGVKINFNGNFEGEELVEFFKLIAEWRG